MKQRIASRLPLFGRKQRRSQEAGAVLFQGLRIRLTLWYCGVMGLALVLFGVALYFGAAYSLLYDIENNVAPHSAYGHLAMWRSSNIDGACSSFGPHTPFRPPDPGEGFTRTEWIACFDQHGSVVQNDSTGSLPSAFLSNTTLIQSVLQTHQPNSAIVDAGGNIGQMYCYAVPLPNPQGSGYVGVLLVGESIKVQEGVLSSLLMLLLSIGGVALLGAALGGLFLSNRALAPARLAWANQQRFIADASHELRTPLTLLRADAEVLLRGRGHLDAEDAELLEDIVAEANHMSRLANNMLTLARLDAHASPREYEVINLSELAQNGVRRVQAFAEQSGISITDEGDKNVLVIGDPTQLEQAILALLDNAIKYNQQGGQVRVHTERKQGQALLVVSDTGIGIDAEHLAHLGERFYRVDKARSRAAGGTGLGLSIVRGIAHAHRGSLSLASVPHQGTTVTLSLPLAANIQQRETKEERLVSPSGQRP